VVSGWCSDQELAAEVAFEAVDLFEQTRLAGAEGSGGGSQRGVAGRGSEALQSVPAEESVSAGPRIGNSAATASAPRKHA
jgi:hypothetical protein